MNAALATSRIPAQYNGKRAALLLTHDLDSARELDLISDLTELERAFGIRSSFGFVPARSWPSDKTAMRLLEGGWELYLHDIAHDGRLPYRSLDDIRRELDRALNLSGWATERLRAFRAGQLLMSRNLLRVVGERFAIDLSIPDSERAGPYGEHAGCGTVLPFQIGGLLEFPLSMPQEVFLEQVYRLAPDRILEIWVTKLEHIVKVGGVATLNTHPLWVNKRRPKMWRAYELFVERATSRADLLITTPSELANILHAPLQAP